MFANLLLIFLCFQCIDSQLDSTQKIENFPGEECLRNCSSAIPTFCYFKFRLEYFSTLGLACGTCGAPGGSSDDCFNKHCVTADGVKRGVMTINRQIPASPIHVCKGDLIVVDVVNKMAGTATSVHWHGFHQRNFPHSDGVPFVTQCPINFGNTFRYAFRASEPGTQFYHSHSGHHKINGQYGGIVVRGNPKDDPNSETYDVDLPEHLMVISDWMDNLAEAYEPGTTFHTTGPNPKSFLMNGRGRILNKTTGESITSSQLAVFTVKRGKRYRFRLVNSMGLSCPAELSIKGHSFHVIAADSRSIRPVNVSSLTSSPGERYDFVINAIQPENYYLIRIKAIGSCRLRQVQQFAVLSYTEESESEVPFPTQKLPSYSEMLDNDNASFTLGSLDNNCLANGSTRNFCAIDLTSYRNSTLTTAVPDHKFYLGFNLTDAAFPSGFADENFQHFYHPFDNLTRFAVINNISFVPPTISLLSQTDDIDESIFCDPASLPEHCRGENVCHCTHRLKIKLNSVVELILVDEQRAINKFGHPVHLHGNSFKVIGSGAGPNKFASVAEVKELDREGLLDRSKVDFAPIRDTITIPQKGYVVLRFKADNPGFWMLHCHMEFHFTSGMSVILQAGDHNQMVKPPANFPKCNNFVPNLQALSGVQRIDTSTFFLVVAGIINCFLYFYQ